MDLYIHISVYISAYIDPIVMLCLGMKLKVAQHASGPSSVEVVPGLAVLREEAGKERLELIFAQAVHKLLHAPPEHRINSMSYGRLGTVEALRTQWPLEGFMIRITFWVFQ